MSMQHSARIHIKDLRLRTYIGINDDEIRNRQDVVINIRLRYDIGSASWSEDINDALNYRTITKQVISLVENERFGLLEKLTADVLGIVSAPPQVEWAEVEVDKPHALRFADSVSMALTYTRT